MSHNGDRQEWLPPHSIEAEEAVLGAIMIYPFSLFDAAFLTPDDFYIIRNRMIFQAMLDLHTRGEEIDNLTVCEELKARGELDEIGGPLYITQLVTHTPGSINTASYAQRVRRTAIRRRLEDACREMVKIAYSEDVPIEEAIAQADRAFFAWHHGLKHGRAASAEEIAGEVLIEAEAAYSAYQRGESVGLPTGFTDLDDLIGGLHKNDLYILAGRPSMGKTALVLSILFTLARAGVPVGLFSLEMNRQQTVQRLISMETGISTHAIRNGRLTQGEFALLVEANDRIGRLPFWVDDTPAHNILALRSQAQGWHLEHGIKAVFVDYLQLATGDQNRENRTLEVGSISRGLKQCARELEIPVIAAAQLNRNVETRAEKRPGLSDLRESGDIENDADLVAFVYRDQYYHPETEAQNVGEIIVAKQRNGPTGKAELYWQADTMQFKNMITTEQLDLRGYSPAYADNARS